MVEATTGRTRDALPSVGFSLKGPPRNMSEISPHNCSLVVGLVQSARGRSLPTGSSGCIEARILAVADAIEDLTSHRVFRNAFPLGGYDPKVVAVCQRLFREKEYNFN